MKDPTPLYNFIDTIMETIQEQRKHNDRDGLLVSGLKCLEIVERLVDVSIENESAYRKFEAELSEERDENGKRVSGAYCETKSKATDFYREWQRARQTIELLYDMANMAKAISKGLDNQIKAS